jgi:pyochelin biosynthetic protein PchC
VSGRLPPHKLEGRRLGTDEEFIADAVRFDPSCAAAFADPDLREMVLPAIRADYRMSAGYTGGRRPPLDCPVYAYIGAEDSDLLPERMLDWADMTRDSFRLRVLPGGHLYLKTAEGALLADLSGVLSHIKFRMEATS